jgi:hypothetical protein
MHPDFRLFSTQNPSTGAFAGHRMELPESLTSRFLFVSFDRLPESDLVVFAHLSLVGVLGAAGGDASTYAREVAQRIVPVHIRLETLVNDPSFRCSCPPPHSVRAVEPRTPSSTRS